MPAPDPTNVLFKIAHPDLYERNPFNVLNLSVDATAKDIRRRREDIEAAFDAGTETDEFADILPRDPNRKTPTRDAVEAAFASLENPEERLGWELFWFWETKDISSGLTGRTKSVTNSNSRFDKQHLRLWETAIRQNEQSDERVIFLHNLAIAYHSSALMGNSPWDRSVEPFSPDFRDKIWTSAIQYWNRVVSSDDTWHILVDKVTRLNDPRIDYKTVRGFREQFAFAFDQINVELAIAFAKSGREEDAKRQVRYMKLSQPDSDDVEGTFDDAFAGLLKQTEAIVDASLAEVKAKPKDGLKHANAVLNQTAELLRVSRIVVDKGSPVRDAIVSAVFAGVRGCLIAYGNETKDWDGCLKIAEELNGITETEEQKRNAEDDVKFLTRQREADRCWFCTNRWQTFIEIMMYGCVERGFGSVRWKTMTVRVPVCSKCKEKHNQFKLRSKMLGCSSMIVFTIIGGIIGSCIHNSAGEPIIGGVMLGFAFGWLMSKILDMDQIFKSYYLDIKSYPVVARLLKQGFEFGSGPPGRR